MHTENVFPRELFLSARKIGWCSVGSLNIPFPNPFHQRFHYEYMVSGHCQCSSHISNRNVWQCFYRDGGSLLIYNYDVMSWWATMADSRAYVISWASCAEEAWTGMVRIDKSRFRLANSTSTIKNNEEIKEHMGTDRHGQRDICDHGQIDISSATITPVSVNNGNVIIWFYSDSGRAIEILHTTMKYGWSLVLELVSRKEQLAIY